MMEYHQSSQIPTLSYIENEDHPVFGTLVEQILHLLNSKLVFSDIIIHQNSPLMLRQPKGLVAVTDSPITREELEEFFEVIEPNWAERINERAFDRSIDLHTARIRANCFSFQGKKRLGCVIRRFPKEALALAESGPLVLATLHARSTELGLQKMLRLLGNSDAQGQALAHALRGVLCQALLPSKQGNRYYLATECLSISPAVSNMIEEGDLGAIRRHMNAG